MTEQQVKVAAIQMASGPQVGANLIEAERLARQAAEEGARLIVLPENFAIMGLSEADRLVACERPGEGPIQDFLSRLARGHNLWIIGGTIPMHSGQADKAYASSLVYNNDGDCVGRYDKLHLFDVSLEDSGEDYTESETTQPGDNIVVIDSPFGRLGLAVCYDIRFPELFRAMVARGAEIFVVPAAFTAFTGKAHWEMLLRARAVENLCYVIASAQGGYHLNGRETYGHSMIIDPWGNILDELPQGSGIVSATIDQQLGERIRSRFPALDHRRINSIQDVDNDND